MAHSSAAFTRCTSAHFCSRGTKTSQEAFTTPLLGACWGGGTHDPLSPTLDPSKCFPGHHVFARQPLTLRGKWEHPCLSDEQPETQGVGSETSGPQLHPLSGERWGAGWTPWALIGCGTSGTWLHLRGV